MLVVLLLVLIWAAVLVPPAVVAHRQRQEAFLVSFGPPLAEAPRPRPNALRIQRRRRIAGGLLVATVATLVVGLLPTFRVFLVVHLFLLDSFLFYVAVLAYGADKAARAREPRAAGVEDRAPRRLRPRRPVMLPAG
ncbi:MAG TPA: hypothetical protein VHF27_04525 [Acidimicrobiales bacterium]|nr:hypothetical protein [Acidimicrobiales bacterium]